MNRRPPSLPMAKAIPGFLQYKAAEALSPRTLENYRQQLELWQTHVGDYRIDQVSASDLQAYLVWLRDTYQATFTGAAFACTCYH